MVKIESTASATFESDNDLSSVFNNLQYYSTLMKSNTKNSYTLYSLSRPQFKRDKRCETGTHKNGLALANHIKDYIYFNFVFGISIIVFCSLTIICGIMLFTKISKTSRTLFFYQLFSIVASLLVIAYMTIIWVYTYSYNMKEHYSKFE